MANQSKMLFILLCSFKCTLGLLDPWFSAIKWFLKSVLDGPCWMSAWRIRKRARKIRARKKDHRWPVWRGLGCLSGYQQGRVEAWGIYELEPWGNQWPCHMVFTFVKTALNAMTRQKNKITGFCNELFLRDRYCKMCNAHYFIYFLQQGYDIY